MIGARVNRLEPSNAQALPAPGAGVPRQGGRLLVDQLIVHGVDLAFGVPGESYLPVLDALHDAPIKFVTCRHESAAANMADAYGKMTGRPGVCFVTRGPGAAHASVGIHTAFQDSTPLVLFVGQVASLHEDREGFQEIDCGQMFSGMAKWTAQIRNVDRIPEYVSRAFSVACSGRPGPVVLALPEDMLEADSLQSDAPPFQIARPYPHPRQVAQLRAWLASARRPMAVIGGGGWSARAARGVGHFLEANDIPTATAFRRQDALDNNSRCFVGDVGFGINPLLRSRLQAADRLLVIGPRLGEVTTDKYSLLSGAAPDQKLIHVHPGAEELGRVFHPDLSILCAMDEFAASVEDLVVPNRWHEWGRQARADYERWQEPGPVAERGLDVARCVMHLHERLPSAIVTNGAGNFALWVHRFWRYAAFPSCLAPTSGAMGYGLPAAIAAKLVAPSRPVICFAGDGDFLMAAQELATAVQNALPILVLVVNNGMYGTIRLHQERRYPGRPVGTSLTNPDFAAYARAFGAHGESVRDSADFPAALERALRADCAAIIELHTDPTVMIPQGSVPAASVRSDPLQSSREERSVR